MDKLYLCQNIFFIDWCHKCLKNTTDLFLFYREHFYGFLESDLWKCWKKTFHNKYIYIYIYGHRQFEVWWSFILYKLQRFVLSFKTVLSFNNSFIPTYMNKKLLTLGNEKEQQQIKFYEKLSGKLIFSHATKNLKMFYFTATTRRVL